MVSDMEFLLGFWFMAIVCFALMAWHSCRTHDNKGFAFVMLIILDFVLSWFLWWVILPIVLRMWLSHLSKERKCAEPASVSDQH